MRSFYGVSTWVTTTLRGAGSCNRRSKACCAIWRDFLFLKQYCWSLWGKCHCGLNDHVEVQQKINMIILHHTSTWDNLDSVTLVPWFLAYINNNAISARGREAGEGIIGTEFLLTFVAVAIPSRILDRESRFLSGKWSRYPAEDLHSNSWRYSSRGNGIYQRHLKQKSNYWTQHCGQKNVFTYIYIYMII